MRISDWSSDVCSSDLIETVDPSFGFAVAVHPERPGTAWFVPAIKDEYRYPKDGRLVVTRTPDGGKSFDTLTDGLPQTHAYDLIYRHALEVRSEERRVGKGCVSTCRSRGPQYH